MPIAANAIIKRLRRNIQVLPFAASLTAKPALFWLLVSIFPENVGDEKRLNRCTGCISSGIGACDNKSGTRLPRHGKTHGLVRPA
jgi:hypothetical protein